MANILSAIFIVSCCFISFVQSSDSPKITKDDRNLVDKYCPVSNVDFISTSPHPDKKFYVYSHRDYIVTHSETSLREGMNYFFAGGRGSAENSKIYGEFYGEASMWCELLKHPQRTHDIYQASLFIVPIFPFLAKQDIPSIFNEIQLQPSWTKNKGRDHLIMCTHWACNVRLGISNIFQHLALPGYLGALERNFKWLDPRIYHLDSFTVDWDRVNATALSVDQHTLCPERVIVLPYPAHNGLESCRLNDRVHIQKEKDRVGEYDKTSMVFYAGTVRVKLCGEGSHEASGGVRTALTQDSLFDKYGKKRRRKLSSSSNNHFASTDEMEAEMDNRGYHIYTFSSGTHGGKRIGDLGSTYVTRLKTSYFCLHLRGDTPTSRRFYDAIAAGCLPIVISDKFGAGLPFTLNNQINYGDWLTIIPQDRFIHDPIGEMDAITKEYFYVEGGDSSIGNLKPKPALIEMQKAMLRDRNKLIMCSGTGEVGNQLIQEAFSRIVFRKELQSGDLDGCYASNHEKQLELYATETGGGFPGWLDKFKNKYKTDWTWCVEIETTYQDYQNKTHIHDRRNNSLRLDALTHIS